MLDSALAEANNKGCSGNWTQDLSHPSENHTTRPNSQLVSHWAQNRGRAEACRPKTSVLGRASSCEDQPHCLLWIPIIEYGPREYWRACGTGQSQHISTSAVNTMRLTAHPANASIRQCSWTHIGGRWAEIKLIQWIRKPGYRDHGPGSLVWNLQEITEN